MKFYSDDIKDALEVASASSDVDIQAAAQDLLNKINPRPKTTIEILIEDIEGSDKEKALEAIAKAATLFKEVEGA